MDANGSGYFKRKSTKRATCIKCSGPIIPEQWFTWDRSQGGKPWHYDCQDVNAIPPEHLQVRRKGLPPVTPSEPRNFSDPRPEPIEEPEPCDPEPEPKVNAPKLDGGLQAIADLLAPYLDGKIKSGKEDLRALFEEYCARLRDTMTTKVELTLPSGDIKKLDGVHKLFPKLAKLISLRQWAYLYGPSASFKSTSAKLAAQSLELSFGCITLNPMTFPSALFGYMDANGNYVRTPFRDAYEFGGVFLIDEMDNASGQVLTLLNPALGNGHCPFADGLVTMHPNFVCIATGNTAGRGGSKNHAERRMFDAATTRRFVFLEWDYDWTLVRAMTLAMCDKAGGWCDYIKKLDAYLRVNHPHVLATPQSSFDGAKLMQDDFFTVSEIAYMTIWKGLDHDTVAKIVAANPLPQIEGMRA